MYRLRAEWLGQIWVETTVSLISPIDTRETAVLGDPQATPHSQTRQVWPRSDAQAVKRALRVLDRYDVACGLVCKHCEQGVVAKREDHTGYIHLICACCVRVQEGTW